MSDAPESAGMGLEETETKEIEFEDVWEDFVNQLTSARLEVKEREDELEKNASLMTRLDLTDLNDARNKVMKLEGACEAIDIIRTQILKEESRIQRAD
tara:strand:+ start:272 stop:565 length:294 start_codon:yes stop_codon:yes gene_type:complete